MPGTVTSHAEDWYRPDIPRQTFKQLMKCSDVEGLGNFGLWHCSGDRLVLRDSQRSAADVHLRST
jgi:hypothetical protein